VVVGLAGFLIMVGEGEGWEAVDFEVRWHGVCGPFVVRSWSVVDD